MDIERVNENTVKFFVTNEDIEDRGFSLDEIWKNRQRGEQLLWEMLDEVQEEVDIEFEGTLKIQVNASDTGLEFIISDSRDDLLTQRISKLFNVNREENEMVVDFNEVNTEDSLDENQETSNEKKLPKELNKVFIFKNIEDVIALYRNSALDQLNAKLFQYKNEYYLHVHFIEENQSFEQFQMLESYILEFGSKTKVTVAVLNEYGTIVIGDQVYQTINKFF